MSGLSSSDIFGANDLSLEDVEISEWPKDGQPGRLRLRQLDAADTLEMTEAMNGSPKDGMFIILVYTARDPETDEKVFPLPAEPEARKEQLAAYVSGLKLKSMKVLNRLQFAAMRVNQMGPGPRAVVDEAIKNA